MSRGGSRAGGGINVLALAACRPDLIAGVVLVESSHPEQLVRMPDVDGALLRAVHALAKAPAPLAQVPARAVRRLVRLASRRAPPGARVMAELAPSIVRRLDGVVAEHDAGPALFRSVGARLAETGLPDVPMVVLTGDQNFSDPGDQATWARMHEELAASSEQGEHVHIACGHEMPFSRPDAAIDAITDVLARHGNPHQ